MKSLIERELVSNTPKLYPVSLRCLSKCYFDYEVSEDGDFDIEKC